MAALEKRRILEALDKYPTQTDAAKASGHSAEDVPESSRRARHPTSSQIEEVKNLILKLVFFVVSVVGLYLVAHNTLNWGHQHMRTRHDPNAIYMLGDSRVVFGVDRARLSELTGRPIHGYAAEGIGIYAFYALSEKIPDGATVLVGPTLGMFFKPERRLEWRSGLSLGGLRLLVEEGFSTWALKRVLATNREPLQTPYLKQQDTMPVEPEPNWLETADFRLYKSQKEKPPIFERNQALFTKAVEELLARGCKLKFVDFPVTDKMRSLRAASIYGEVFDEIDVLKDESLPIEKYRVESLPTAPGENLFYDYDHLNVVGARRMSERIARDVFGVKTSTTVDTVNR